MASKIKIEDGSETQSESQPETPPTDENASKSKKKSMVKKADRKNEVLLRELEEKLEAKEQDVKGKYDSFLRVSAEFENYKKRSSREMSDFKKFANETLLKEMLTVVDNLERALESAGENEDCEAKVLEGVELTLKEVLRILENFGVKPIDALEVAFDPNYHQAVMQEASEDHPEQTVLRELQKGYLLHDRLLRPAMVVVSK